MNRLEEDNDHLRRLAAMEAAAASSARDDARLAEAECARTKPALASLRRQLAAVGERLARERGGANAEEAIETILAEERVEASSEETEVQTRDATEVRTRDATEVRERSEEAAAAAERRPAAARDVAPSDPPIAAGDGNASDSDDEELFDDLDESWATDAAAEDRAPEEEDEDPTARGAALRDPT